MKILIVSYFFPPYNTIGAVRVGKLAKYWHQSGHDVRVISAVNQNFPPDLPLEVPDEQVIYTKWLNINQPFKKFQQKSAELVGGMTKSSGSSGRTSRQYLEKMISIYKALANYPDECVGWLPYAKTSAARLLAKWQPDLIYASARPFTSLLLARSLSLRAGLPWVAELRDLWADNHYLSRPTWRQFLDERLEKKVLSKASGLVTVSEPLAAILREKYQKPCAVVLNGFVKEDFPAISGGAESRNVVISYTGLLYSGKRDPSPLFAALAGLGEAAERFKVVFYGSEGEYVRELAEKYGVTRCVEVRPHVPYRECLALQRRSDILLLLLWNVEQEQGVYTGKVFEYFGARRPILVLGPRDNVASKLVMERGAGYVATDPAKIADRLRAWLREKEENGSIADLPVDVGRGLSREEQFGHLDEFISSLL